MKATCVMVVVTILLLVAFHPLATRAKPIDSEASNTAAIKKLFTDFNDALNNHDARAAVLLFTDDADYIILRGTTIHGKAELEQHLAPWGSGRIKNMHREVILRGIRLLRPDTATVVSDFVTSGLTEPTGAAVPPTKGLYDWIVVQQNGRWLIAVWHESNVPATPAQ